MKNFYNRFIMRAVMCFALTALSCLTGRQLSMEPANASVISGTYSVMLYGCKYPDDRENVAIMVNEAGPYPLELYVPDFMYVVKRGLSARQALAEANRFIRCSFHDVWSTQLLRIPDEKGGTIAYEMQPLYSPLEFGSAEVVLSSYVLKQGKVVVYFFINPSSEIDRDRIDRDSSTGK